MADDEPETTINRFLDNHEHLFVIAGVFGALAVYISQIRTTLDIPNPGRLDLGISSALFLSLAVSLLFIRETARRYQIIPPSLRNGSIERFTGRLFLLTFVIALYLLVFTIAAAMMTLTSAVLYLATLVIMAVIAIILISIFDALLNHFEVESARRQTAYMTIYSAAIAVLAFLLFSAISLQYDVGTGAILNMEPYPTMAENIISVAMILCVLFTMGAGALTAVGAVIFFLDMLYLAVRRVLRWLADTYSTLK